MRRTAQRSLQDDGVIDDATSSWSAAESIDSPLATRVVAERRRVLPTRRAAIVGGTVVVLSALVIGLTQRSDPLSVSLAPIESLRGPPAVEVGGTFVRTRLTLANIDGKAPPEVVGLVGVGLDRPLGGWNGSQLVTANTLSCEDVSDLTAMRPVALRLASSGSELAQDVALTPPDAEAVSTAVNASCLGLAADSLAARVTRTQFYDQVLYVEVRNPTRRSLRVDGFHTELAGRNASLEPTLNTPLDVPAGETRLGLYTIATPCTFVSELSQTSEGSVFSDGRRGGNFVIELEAGNDGPRATSHVLLRSEDRVALAGALKAACP